MMLITNWLSCASSSGESTDVGRQDHLEELIGVADPLLADRLVGVVGDRQGIVQVDLLVAVGQRRQWRQAGIAHAVAVLR